MTPEGEIAPAARKTGRGWVDLSVAVCALIVSATSLWIAVRHGHTMERMAEANARLVSANSYPLLQWFVSSAADLQSADYAEGTRVASLNVRNTGVGPAKVETLEVFWNDRPDSARIAASVLRYVRRCKPVVTRGNCGPARRNDASGRVEPPPSDRSE